MLFSYFWVNPGIVFILPSETVFYALTVIILLPSVHHVLSTSTFLPVSRIHCRLLCTMCTLCIVTVLPDGCSIIYVCTICDPYLCLDKNTANYFKLNYSLTHLIMYIYIYAYVCACVFVFKYNY